MRARQFVVGFSAMVLSGAAAGVLGAQPVLVRGDVLLTLGGGAGFGASTCGFCTESGLPAFTYRAGYALQTNLVVGIEGTWAMGSVEGPCSRGCSFFTPRSPESAYFRAASHAVMVQWYPRWDRPYFVKFGVGAATNRVEHATERRSSDSPPVHTVRERLLFNPRAGVGVERQIAPRLSLSAHLDLSHSIRGRVSAGSAALSETFVYSGIALTWRAW